MQVIPPFLVAIFTPEELELLVCGLPSVDVDDWKKHMRYFGEFNSKHKVFVVQLYTNVCSLSAWNYTQRSC